MPNRVVRLVAVAWLAVTFASVPRAAASPQDLFGYGPRTQAMGMTGASYASGYEAVYANPAGLADTRGYNLDLGFSANDFRLEVDNHPSAMPTSRGIVIGLALPLPFGGPLRDVFTLGAGFFTPTNTVMQAEAPYPERIQWPVLTRSQVVALQFAMSVNLDRWLEGLRLGFGVSGAANTIGKIDVGLDAANQFVSRTETQLTSNFSPILGVRYQRPRYAIGLVYRAELASRIDMDVEVHDLPVQLPLLTIHALAQYDPHQLVAEVSYLPTASLRLVAGFTYRRWSQYPGPLSKSSEGSHTPPRPNFHDTITPRVAAEWTRDEGRVGYAVRGGYVFEPTPAPVASNRLVLDSIGDPLGDGSTVAVRYLDSNRHVLTTGFGLRVALDANDPDSMRFRVDFSGSLQVVTARRHALSREGTTAPLDSRGLIPGASVTVGAAW